MNKIVKYMWKVLGPNLNEQSAEPLADTLEPVEAIMETINRDCSISKSKGYRSEGKTENAVQQITIDLINSEAFRFHSGTQGHPFPNFLYNMLHKLDYRDLHTWMKGLSKTWE